MNEIEEIKARLDIVEVIGASVRLQRAGRAYKALCPFHSEKTPSFIVSPDRQSWHCFGACGTGGDIIAFVMKREGIDFPTALRLLAERAGVKLPERRASREQEERNARLYAANAEAARYYQALLLESDAAAEARAYLEKRGVDRAAIEKFALGYSLPGWDGLRRRLAALGFSDEEMLRAGLLVEGDGRPYDRFRGRLMFAIRDEKGRVAGFGARALGDSLPKYINTPATPLFDKSGTLYALDRAQAAIRAAGCAVIVEGYMDAIAAHQHGFENVVAQMGTALTEKQVRTLKRFASRIVLALDADAAGSEAMVRGHEVVREALAGEEAAVPVVTWRGLVRYQEAVSVDLRVAVLPEGRDPDDVIRADPGLWRSLVADAQPVLDFRLQAAAAAHDLSEPRGRSELVREFLPLLAQVGDPVVRAHYLQRLARLALAGEEALAAMLREIRPARPRSQAPPAAVPAPRRGDSREEFLLALLFRYPDLRADGLETPEDLFWEAENREVFAAWKRNPELEAVKAALPVELAPHLERLLMRKAPAFETKQAREAFIDCRQRLERRAMEFEKQSMTALLAAREEELGPVLPLPEDEPDDERVKELAVIQQRDTEAGLRLHARERSGP
jgi:DNA primase